MPDSDITVSGLVATPGIGHIGLQYVTVDPHAAAWLNRSLDVVEVWASVTNDRGTATKVAEGNKTSALHVALLEGTTWFYWIKPRDREGLYGDWFPSSPTAGVQVTVGFAASAVYSLINGKIVVPAPVGNALLIQIKTIAGNDPSASDPVIIAFRSSDLTSGALSFVRIVGPLSFTISNGSLVGTLANTPFRIWVSMLSVAGVPYLAIKNCYRGSIIYALPEMGVVSATAEGGVGGADSAGVLYASILATNAPMRIIGYLEWTSGLPVAGAWSAGPNIIQMFGPGIKKPGDIVQEGDVIGASIVSGAFVIPFDNTKPQVSEGWPIGSVTFATTPSPANVIERVVDVTAAGDTSGPIIAAIFRDAETDACASFPSYAVADNPVTIGGKFIEQAYLSPLGKTTLNVGVASGNLYLNRNSSATLLGNTLYSTLTSRELMG